MLCHLQPCGDMWKDVFVEMLPIYQCPQNLQMHCIDFVVFIDISNMFNIDYSALLSVSKKSAINVTYIFFPH
jgi:hypothetical protein